MYVMRVLTWKTQGVFNFKHPFTDPQTVLQTHVPPCRSLADFLIMEVVIHCVT
jgi:hypothetical protein